MPHRRTPVRQPQTRRNTVSTTPAARPAVRLRRAAAERETHHDLISARAEDIRSRGRAAPLTFTRWARRHADYTAGPAAALLYCVTEGFLAILTVIGVPGAALLHTLLTLLPWWLSAALTGTAVGYWAWMTQHTQRTRKRWLEDDGARVRELFRPRYETIDIEKLPHRRTDYGLLPPGYSVGQYQDQEPVLRASLRHPVTIREARPGVIAVTQMYQDLLAAPVPWRDHLEVIPAALWHGIDTDGRDIHAALTAGGSGLAFLLGGAPGSGKTAHTHALLAQIVMLPAALRRLWIIDPADGVDLGCWHPFAYRLAENPRAALQLLRDLIRDMELRRPRMTAAGIDVCEPSEAFPWNILVIDELPELTLNEDKDVRTEACELLARIRRVGRKTNTSIIAITQDLSQQVVPTQLSKIFSHRICFHVSTYREADIILPGARRHGYHPELFSPEHPGRFILWDLSTYREGRSCGLYGRRRQEVVTGLSMPRPSDVQHVNGHSTPHSPPAVHLNGTPLPPPNLTRPTDTADSITPDPERRTAHELRVLLHTRGDTAGRAGLNVAAEAAALQEPEWRIRRCLRELKYVKRGRAWITPEAAR